MTTQSFWEERHRTGDRYWLTGTSLDEYTRMYDLCQIRDGKLRCGPDDTGVRTVTEIGVGTGRATRQMVELGLDVAAVDVSEEALRALGGPAVMTCHTRDLAKLRPADLVLCHLVFQHVDAAEVQRILSEAQLTPGGVFCFQTAWMTEPARGLAEDMHGLVWHLPAEVARMAAVAKLDVYWSRMMRFLCKSDVVWWSCFKAQRLPLHQRLG